MGKNSALLTLAMFGAASDAWSLPLIHRQADPAALSTFTTLTPNQSIVVVPVTQPTIVVVPVPHATTSPDVGSITPAPSTSAVVVVTASTTIKSLPTGAKVETLTGSVSWTTDQWITTTSSGDKTSTVVPVIFPSISGKPGPVAPVIIFGGITPPTVTPPSIELDTPELGCVQFIGATVGSCPSDDPENNSKTDKPSTTTTSSDCTSNTATITSIECSSMGTSSHCETRTSQTVGCSVTGRLTSTGSCVASTTIASSSICCASVSVTSGKTVCAFATLTGVALYPSPTHEQTALGSSQLLSMLSSYYHNFGAGNGTAVSTAAAPSPTPICDERTNELAGTNNDPSSWCFCGGRGPFSTIPKATTSYCAFSTLPSQTISLTSHSTSVDSACHESTTTISPATTPTAYCQCGNIVAAIGTSIMPGGTTVVGCELFPTWSIFSTVTPTAITVVPVTPTAITVVPVTPTAITVVPVTPTAITVVPVTPAITVAPVPAPTAAAPAPAPAPSAPYADQGGQCHIHVKEVESCTNDNDNLKVEITMWDVAGKQIGFQPRKEAGADDPLKMPSKLEALLEVTPEHTGDYIQFTLGTESWTSKDNDKKAAVYCNTGDWDPKQDPVHDPDFACTVGSLVRQRLMDCFFQCPWHGGKSSDSSVSN